MKVEGTGKLRVGKLKVGKLYMDTCLISALGLCCQQRQQGYTATTAVSAQLVSYTCMKENMIDTLYDVFVHDRYIVKRSCRNFGHSLEARTVV